MISRIRFNSDFVKLGSMSNNFLNNKKNINRAMAT